MYTLDVVSWKKKLIFKIRTQIPNQLFYIKDYKNFSKSVFHKTELWFQTQQYRFDPGLRFDTFSSLF